LNFFVFITDAHPAQILGCDGNETTQTPNIDGLANDGVQFERRYVNQPMCMATRATWLTGFAPRGHKVRCNGIRLDCRIPTVAEALKDTGYCTYAVGKMHLRPTSLRKGALASNFDPSEWCECGELWRSGRVDAIHAPCYGFSKAAFAGHSTGNNFR
jgi:arylsulfatase A-like enzyme